MIHLKTVLLGIFFLSLFNLSAQEVDSIRISKYNGKYYIDGTKLFSGSSVSYYENGKISYRAYYTKGNIYGICQWWYSNGQLKKHISYDIFHGKSLINGSCFEYDKYGNQLTYGFYKAGRLISGERFLPEVYKGSCRPYTYSRGEKRISER